MCSPRYSFKPWIIYNQTREKAHSFCALRPFLYQQRPAIIYTCLLSSMVYIDVAFKGLFSLPRTPSIGVLENPSSGLDFQLKYGWEIFSPFNAFPRSISLHSHKYTSTPFDFSLLFSLHPPFNRSSTDNQPYFKTCMPKEFWKMGFPTLGSLLL